jgi:hypothetical protein
MHSFAAVDVGGDMSIWDATCFALGSSCTQATFLFPEDTMAISVRIVAKPNTVFTAGWGNWFRMTEFVVYGTPLEL